MHAGADHDAAARRREARLLIADLQFAAERGCDSCSTDLLCRSDGSISQAALVRPRLRCARGISLLARQTAMGANGPLGLPMYDPPELHATVDAWWSGLRARLRAEGVTDVPRPASIAVCRSTRPWGAPDLLFTQTCGYPTGRRICRPLCNIWPRRAMRRQGCTGSSYCSWIVVAADSARTRLE